MSTPQGLNLMILGAQSSIASAVMKELTSHHSKIIGTHSSPLPPKSSFNSIDWQHLDLENPEGISKFLELNGKKPFDVVLNLIGKLSYLGRSANLADIAKYFNTHVTNHTYLVEQLLQLRNYQPLLYINFSSRSVTYGSNDLYYSQAKSAIHCLTKSLAKLYRGSSFINLIPGLIKDSAMYLSMPENVQSDHVLRAGRPLMELDEVGKFVVNLIHQQILNRTSEPGVCLDLRVGPQYE